MNANSREGTTRAERGWHIDRGFSKLSDVHLGAGSLRKAHRLPGDKSS
jgi:hypothetical protein